MSATAPRYRRRDFLRALLAAGVGAPLLSSLGCEGNASPMVPTGRDAEATALAYFEGGTLEHAASIGAEYRYALSPSGDMSVIDDDLAELVALIQAAETDQDALNEVLAEVETDFSEGRMMTLLGWSLGRTELRICALVSFVLE